MSHYNEALGIADTVDDGFDIDVDHDVEAHNDIHTVAEAYTDAVRR